MKNPCKGLSAEQVHILDSWKTNPNVREEFIAAFSPLLNDYFEDAMRRCNAKTLDLSPETREDMRTKYFDRCIESAGKVKSWDITIPNKPDEYMSITSYFAIIARCYVMNRLTIMKKAQWKAENLKVKHQSFPIY